MKSYVILLVQRFLIKYLVILLAFTNCFNIFRLCYYGSSWLTATIKTPVKDLDYMDLFFNLLMSDLRSETTYVQR